ncbi:MAG TPA: 3-phosphoserine/phosphohydroxythreonine transaminase [Gallionella sp.]|nr:MAG: phosphoserine transaminase [Gallionellales bacterium GWA2_54_124]OGT19065.1 MAG: phosphoserine transaminase [Gallionellales bacterium RIFOXYD12_FULL_53_10]HCI53462.1 3-phosphoserine/phosphohydroxythreonine transaminase [Gallionella sp.]
MTIYNFAAGPAILPHEVLEQARAELLDWRGTGMSVMEMSHRGREFMGIAAEAEADLRELMAIPDNYKVLFLQGGATLQFAMIPLNLMRGKVSADYVNTGIWSKKAIDEAMKFGHVNVVATSADRQFSYAPELSGWKLDEDAAYVHYTPNETIGGVEFNWVPQVGGVPLVADMSSNILSRSYDVSQFGLIYAGAQKNIGPAGLTLVIVREDLIGHAAAGTPTMLDYKTHADNDSMYNTPPTYGIYMAGLVFKWLKKNGGVAQMEKTNIAKANLLYDSIDASRGFYQCPVATADRSRMNVPFRTADAAMDGEFLKRAEARGLMQLKGHKLAGGMRASIYNAMPVAGVQALADFMNEFAREKAAR